MPEFSCAAAGATPCGWSTRAGSEDELVHKVKQHLEQKHDVAHVTGTLAKYARAVARNEV